MPILMLRQRLSNFSATHLLLAFVCLFSANANAITADNTPTFVGSEQCQTCHQQEFNAWQGSHHEQAMQHAEQDSVLGDFNNVTFTDTNGVENRFYRRAAQYWVNIKGPDGQFHDYQIKYTFGYTPLQQYMVEFDDGRVQLIPFAWDSRTKKQGGQRWFNLYPQFNEKHQEFFWTNTGQNWNYMCADCHSTNVVKNFDVKTNSYQTTFSEINVGCEACHGAASKHLAWTINKTINNLGFNRNLSKSVQQWLPKSNKSTLMPDKIEHSQQTLVCAQCHSRHVQISNNDHVQSKELADRYMLSLINSPLYYPDGQVYDEDFVYGSFLQSKMYENGVVCSNCHDPHSAELTLPVEDVCLQCHQSEDYATPEHHHHQEQSTGAQCVNCHMPETTYMQIDARRDHGWHIPRPDLAKSFGTPDTCLSCHQNKDSLWSDMITKAWQPDSLIRARDNVTPVFTTADYAPVGTRGVGAELSKIAQTRSYPAIIRASALDRMTNIPDRNTLIAIARAVKSPESIIRLGAINGAVELPAAERWRILSPLLSDKVLAVRSEAASALAPLWQTLSTAQQQRLQEGLNDYISIQHFNRDRGFSHTNIGNIYTHQGNYLPAEEAYDNSIKIDPYYVNAYLNKAELYRLLQRNDQALSTLLQGFKKIPDQSELAYAIGLTYIRHKKKSTAADYLKQATVLAPQNANYFYVYGLSIEQKNKLSAYKAIFSAYQISNDPQHLYALCEMQVRHQSSLAQQCIANFAKVAPLEVVNRLKQQYKQQQLPSNQIK